MFTLLWLIPCLPILGFLLLAILGSRFSKTTVALTGAGLVGVAALLTLIIGVDFISRPPNSFTQYLWTWITVGHFNVQIALHLDALSLVMLFVVTFVGFFIHLYAAGFMREEEGYSRFFAYMNLFVGSMLILVLADDLLFLYLGWEGVGLCSYLLIGFWYKDAANGRAARKAFIVTRIGDTAMAIGLFLLFSDLGTLNIQELLHLAPQNWLSGAGIAVAVAALLLGGALGKSAQLPLQTWLPDAMAGPTPVSALIHAATMVTAGVYLIARMHVLFSLAPVVQAAVAVIGALTLLISGFSALAQHDIKRVLAYSTISQIGYMFLALGVGAYTAAVFHLMIHAFFKALLFLAAGVIIYCLHHEHNMFRMGGLRNQLPLTFWTFLIGGASLSALPLVTAGFYSKDLILWQSLNSAYGSFWLWGAGLLGALLTAIYTFRMIFITFFGESKQKINRFPSWSMKIPLIVLAALSLIGGFIETPHTLGHLTLFSQGLQRVLPEVSGRYQGVGMEFISQLSAALVTLLGIYLSYRFYIQKPQERTMLKANPMLAALKKFWFEGWAFDQLYDWLFVKPYNRLTVKYKQDMIDRIYTGIGHTVSILNRGLTYTQTGKLRNYAAVLVLGAILITGLVIVL
jgi:NADH-quinone oxidoreductase subunit L